MNKLVKYLQECWKYRFLVSHLVGADMRSRFRRSHIGILWAIIQPLALAGLFSYVLAVMFQQPFKEQAAYVFSGVVAWELFAQSLSSGSHALLVAEGYLRQSKIPLLVFHLRQTIVNIVMALLGFLGFAIFCFIIDREVISIYWWMIIPWFIVAILVTTPLIIISSVVNVKYRDYQQAVGVGLQALWYVTPAFIPRFVFEKGALSVWSAFNPATTLLDLLRMPLLHHSLWEPSSILRIAIWIIILNVIALIVLARNERKLIYSY